MKLELNLDDKFSLLSKLNGIPKIIYRNNPEDVERNSSMEQNFNIWRIVNHKRHENKYLPEKYSEWKDLITDDNLVQTPSELCKAINIIDSIVTWYDNDDDESCIIMGDNVSFSTVTKWPFDWIFLERHLPYNWDCLQLFVASKNMLKMHMHPWIPGNVGYDCFMITRYFAKRVKHYHYINGRYKLHYDTPNKSISFTDYGNLKTFFYNLGTTYSFPLFPLDDDDTSVNSDFDGLIENLSSQGIKYWWENKSKNFSNFELFHYNKGDDEWKMELTFDLENKKTEVHMDPRVATKIWI